MQVLLNTFVDKTVTYIVTYIRNNMTEGNRRKTNAFLDTLVRLSSGLDMETKIHFLKKRNRKFSLMSSLPIYKKLRNHKNLEKYVAEMRFVLFWY